MNPPINYLGRPSSYTVITKNGKIVMSHEDFLKHMKIIRNQKKKHHLRCATCGKFIKDSDAIWHNVIDGFPSQPYHSDCNRP